METIVEYVVKGMAIVGISCAILAMFGVVFLVVCFMKWLSKETVE